MTAVMITLGIYSRTGGIEAYNRRIVRCLAEMSGKALRESHVTSLWDEPPDAASVPARVGFFPGSSNKFRTAAHFLQRVRTMRPDVVLYGHVMLTPLAVLARTMSRRSRQVLFVYGTDVWGDPDYRNVPPYEIAAVRRCVDQVVTISGFTAVRMARTFRLPESRFSFLPCAVDLRNGDSAKAASRTNRQPGTLLTVSRMGTKDRYKGIDRVILALPQILRAIPRARYLVVGEGPLKPELMALAERTGVSNRVEFLGHLDDAQLEETYASSDVFLMPSTGEGFGIVFLEAWKHRLPVICGNRDASSEVVTNNLNGLTVEPNEVRQIADAAIRLLSDEPLAASLGENGYRTLIEKYSHAAFRTRLEAILLDQRCGF